MKKKQRVDQLLVALGHFSTREQAKRAVMAGFVSVEGLQHLKPGQLIDTETEFIIKEREPFVSRGGYKLQAALDGFNLSVCSKICLDVGASTGGFTDCLLQYGAKKVYAVDVGKGLMDWSLRNDPRVVLIEEKNARYMVADDIPEQVDILTIDASFISLKIIIPAVLPFLKIGGYLLPLVKPQFEAGKGQVGKNGVVKDKNLILNILDDMIEFLTSIGLEVNGRVRSPILGPAGNKEFLIWAIKPSVR
ncbi:MAG: TlyA family RNA methyltransferase [Candidatus Auribacterota bacterium]